MPRLSYRLLLFAFFYFAVLCSSGIFLGTQPNSPFVLSASIDSSTGAEAVLRTTYEVHAYTIICAILCTDRVVIGTAVHYLDVPAGATAGKVLAIENLLENPQNGSTAAQV